MCRTVAVTTARVRVKFSAASNCTACIIPGYPEFCNAEASLEMNGTTKSPHEVSAVSVRYLLKIYFLRAKNVNAAA
jgi:hypothetical protein